MRRFHLIYAGALALALAAPVYAQQGELVDAVVATLDKEVILFSELAADISGPEQDLRQTATSQQDYDTRYDQLVKDALDARIELLLMAREARKYPEMTLTEKDIDLLLEDTRKRYTTEEFVQQVGGNMSEFRERVRMRNMAMRMSVSRRRAFEKEIVISDSDITDYYEAHRDQYEHPERVYVRRIFLRVQGGDPEREQARAKLALLREEIENGADFAELAKLHSEAPGAELGGVVGWSLRDDFVEPLSSAAFSLPAGGISEVLDTPFGVDLLKVDEREEAGVTPLSEVRFDIEEALRAEGADEKFKIYMSDLRKRSRVRIFL